MLMYNPIYNFYILNNIVVFHLEQKIAKHDPQETKMTPNLTQTSNKCNHSVPNPCKKHCRKESTQNEGRVEFE